MTMPFVASSMSSVVYCTCEPLRRVNPPEAGCAKRQILQEHRVAKARGEWSWVSGAWIESLRKPFERLGFVAPDGEIQAEEEVMTP